MYIELCKLIDTTHLDLVLELRIDDEQSVSENCMVTLMDLDVTNFIEIFLLRVALTRYWH